MASVFEVYVVPRSPRPGPAGRHHGRPRLRVAAAPEGGRANREAEQALTRLLGARSRVVGGRQSRFKRVEVELEADELARRVAKAFG